MGSRPMKRKDNLHRMSECCEVDLTFESVDENVC